MIDFYIKGGAQDIFGLNLDAAWASLVISIPFYYVMFMYLDQIMPNSHGVKKSLCFCCSRK